MPEIPAVPSDACWYSKGGYDVADAGERGAEGARRWRYRAGKLIHFIIYGTEWNHHEKRIMYGPITWIKGQPDA